MCCQNGAYALPVLTDDARRALNLAEATLADKRRAMNDALVFPPR